MAAAAEKEAPIKGAIRCKITKLETFLVQPRWLFLKVHTNAGLVGLGEPVVEGRAPDGAAAVKEIEPYLIGKDPRPVVHHWQAIYRHAFYRGGPVLTSALSGIDQALWDIKGKALGVPVYELLGGPTRARFASMPRAARRPTSARAIAAGFTAFKTGPAFAEVTALPRSPAPGSLRRRAIRALRKAGGDDVDIAIDFHGKVSRRWPRCSSRRWNRINRCSSRSRSTARITT